MKKSYIIPVLRTHRISAIQMMAGSLGVSKSTVSDTSDIGFVKDEKSSDEEW